MLLRAIARGSRAVSATPKFAARTQVLATLSRGCCSDHAHNHFPSRSLRPQDPAPEFTAAAVIGGEIKKISTADFKGKYWVLCFYPLDFTFVCPTEIIALSDRASDFKALDCNVAVISVDSAFSHLAWVNTPRKAGGLGKMEIPVIADLDKSISEQYGVLLPGGMALRGTFIVDGKGTVRSMSVNDLPVGRNVDEILRTVKAFQHVDKHGEVCPAGWDTGKDTMIADPEKSKAYFKKQKD